MPADPYAPDPYAGIPTTAALAAFDAPTTEAHDAVNGVALPVSTHIERFRAALVDRAGLRNLPKAEPLVEQLLYRDSLAWLQGKPASGKSFLAMDLAGCVSTGARWQTHRITTPGRVLYVVGEGLSGFDDRVEAWEHAMQLEITGVTWLPIPPQAARPSEWNAFIELAVELAPVLIVFDTQARITVGFEENSGRDMGLFVDQLERLRLATRATVLTVHHEPRNAENLRGHTSLEGAAATVLQVTKDDNDVTVTMLKQKDSAALDEIRLRMVTSGKSVVLMPDSQPDGPRLGVRRAAARMAAAWWEMFGSDPASASRLIDAGVATKTTFFRNVRLLVADGSVVKEGTGSRQTYQLRTEPTGSEE